MPQIIIKVNLKPEILDPQGKAILNAIKKMGISEVVDVRQGKIFYLEIDGQISKNLQVSLEKLSKDFLANEVIEDVLVEVQNES